MEYVHHPTYIGIKSNLQVPGFLPVLTFDIPQMSHGLIRSGLVGLLGQAVFHATYSLITFACIIPMIYYWWLAPQGPLLYTVPAWHIYLAIAFKVLAILCFSQFGTPSPVAIGKSTAQNMNPHGITRITRHPLFFGFAFYSLARLVTPEQTYMRDVTFFGGMLVVFFFVDLCRMLIRYFENLLFRYMI